MSREAKRTMAHFLNGLAIAVLAAGTIGPAAIGSFSWGTAGLSLAVGLALHAAALKLTNIED